MSGQYRLTSLVGFLSADYLSDFLGSLSDPSCEFFVPLLVDCSSSRADCNSLVSDLPFLLCCSNGLLLDCFAV
jgi:hypothetical protein